MALTSHQTSPTSHTPSPLTLAHDEITAQATGVLMVLYQLTHEQARAALEVRAARAGHDLHTEAEAIVAEQDAAARTWCTGPEAGVLDRRRQDLSHPAAGGSPEPRRIS